MNTRVKCCRKHIFGGGGNNFFHYKNFIGMNKFHEKNFGEQDVIAEFEVVR